MGQPLVSKSPTSTLENLFDNLSEDDIAELNRVAIRQEYLADVVVCEEGKIEHTFYVIESGMVSVTKNLANGQEQMLGVMRDGEFFGEMGLLDAAPRSATVRTMTDSTLIEISEEAFELLLQGNSSVALTLMRGLTQTLRSLDRLTIAELTLKNQELATALDDLKDAQAELLRQERVNHELEIASEVQRSILPEEFPDVNGLDFGFIARPAREVGGDFYDVVPLDDDKYGIVVADVSGKGWSAALFMAIVRALLSREAPESSSPAETIQSLHEQIMKVSSADMFVTIFYGVINAHTGHIRYVRAGHDRPILYHAATKQIDLLDAPGRFVGLWPDLIIEEADITLTSGDTLVCYSDGVTDAENMDGEVFGIERLLATIQANGHLPAQVLCDRITEKIDQHRGESPATDDITILVTKVT